jgi:hypothetical protein
LLDSTCDATEWRAEYEESFILLQQASENNTVGTFCSSDCHSHFLSALETTATFETDNGYNCGEIWDLESSSSSEDVVPSEDSDDTDTDDSDDDTDTDTDTESSYDTDTDTDTESEASSAKSIIVKDHSSSNDTYPHFSSISVARNLFSGSCVMRGSTNCLLAFIPYYADDTEPTCTQMEDEGCCAGVFANCIAPALEDNVCTDLEACTDVDQGVSTCFGYTSGCDVICSVSATPTPAPRNQFKLSYVLTLAGMSCTDVDTDAKLAVVVTAIKNVISALISGVEPSDIDVVFDCSRKQSLATNNDIYVADAAAASAAQSTLQSTDTATLVSNLNSEIASIAAANGVTGISTATGATVSGFSVTDTSATSGAAIASLTSLVFLLAAFLFM